MLLSILSSFTMNWLETSLYDIQIVSGLGVWLRPNSKGRGEL